MLSVALKIVPLPIAKQFTTDTFKVNETDITHRQSLANTPINNYINNIIDNSVFKDKTATTKSEEQLEDNMYASYTLIKETLENFLKIEIKSEMMGNIESKNIAKKINTVIENIKQLLEKSEEQLKKETIYLNKNMCMLYVLIAYKYKDSSNVDETLYNIIMLLIEKQKELEHICGLKSINKRFEEFNKLIEEVK